MKPAVEVKNVSKSYIINHKNKASYSTLKDDLANIVKRPLGLANVNDGKEEEFWALKNVSFEVPQGEIFGIVGRNGSGKSTMLKILSRIVEPTKGQITLRGRVASLLEVGTGFHPELTGRENIYFNGSMLGMSRQEISQKFDEIVAFSEVEKFLDTPVKFYSSGMYVRLAFSVAAHLDPDILILDEVLAVGDAGFQKKSLQKITETMQRGKTVLFVSHSMGAIQQLCTKGMLLNNGQVEFVGPVGELTEKYFSIIRNEEQDTKLRSEWVNKKDEATNEYFSPLKINLSQNGEIISNDSVKNNQDLKVTIKGEVKQTDELLTLGIGLYNHNKSLIFMSYPSDSINEMKTILPLGQIQMSATIPSGYLNGGDYRISLIGGIHNKFWIYEPGYQNPSVGFRVDEKFRGSPYWKQAREGYVAPVLQWEVKK